MVAAASEDRLKIQKIPKGWKNAPLTGGDFVTLEHAEEITGRSRSTLRTLCINSNGRPKKLREGTRAGKPIRVWIDRDTHEIWAHLDDIRQAASEATKRPNAKKNAERRKARTKAGVRTELDEAAALADDLAEVSRNQEPPAVLQKLEDIGQALADLFPVVDTLASNVQKLSRRIDDSMTKPRLLDLDSRRALTDIQQRLERAFESRVATEEKAWLTCQVCLKLIPTDELLDDHLRRKHGLERLSS